MAEKAALGKRRPLALDTKREIIEMIENKSKTQADIAREYDLGRSTVNQIWKKREKYKSTSQFQANCKKMRSADYDDVEKALLLWLKQARSLCAPVSGATLKNKAVKLANELCYADFNCSDSWLARFKKRRDVVFRTVNGESESIIAQELVDEWLQEKLPKLIDRYDERDIFNADETGLFFKLLPNRTMTFKGDTYHCGEKNKEHLTLMLAVNMDGSEKLPLFAIGKSTKPRCFKGVKSLPVQYRSNRKAWMTGSLFSEWLIGLDKKFVKEQRRVLMIIDNCSAHDPVLAEQLKAIQLEFLPPNCTSKLQPCDMGITQNFKVLYKKRLLNKLITAIENEDMDHFAVDVLQSLRWARSVWENEVTVTTIKNCFQKAGFVKGSYSDASIEAPDFTDCSNIAKQLVELKVLDESMSLDEFLSIDEQVLTTCILTDTEIAAKIKANKDAAVNSEESGDDLCNENDVVVAPPPTTREASMSLTLLQRYMEECVTDPDEADVLMSCVGKIDSHITRTVEKRS